MMRVFAIGFNKCGTRTLHYFFKSNGQNSIHWHKGRLAIRLFKNLKDGNSLLQGYEKVTVFTDMECVTERFFFEGYKLFPYLFEQYPDSVFILNTRSREDWIKSRLNHAEGAYARRHRRILGIESEQKLVEAWAVDWDLHHRRVREFFAGNPKARFIDFNIEKDSVEKLCKSIPELNLNPSKYAIQGKTQA